MSKVAALPAVLYEDIIRNALREDLGRAGDLTSDAVIPMDATAGAVVVARHQGRVAGSEVAAEVFRILDDSMVVRVLVADGEDVGDGGELIQLRGPARAMFAGERTALNLLGHLSGIASLTRAYVQAVDGTDARVVCTRKTTPGLRVLEKYAVRCGGGANHRFGLDDAVLIKDNHLAVAGGVRTAVERARAAVGHTVKIELEVDTLEQLEEGLAVGIDAVLLDNMDVAILRTAVALVDGRCVTEASGGISLDNAASVAATGVDLLSVGALTHSAPSFDVSLDVEAL
jgi:nicotinate-nucleotide pyrophosphorylase (carboxylating)